MMLVEPVRFDDGCQGTDQQRQRGTFLDIEPGAFDCSRTYQHRFAHPRSAGMGLVGNLFEKRIAGTDTCGACLLREFT